MPLSARPVWRLVRDAKAAQYALLLLGPMFIQPLAFIKRPGQPQPLYARLRGLWGTPLVVAGIFAAAMQTLYRWVLWLQSSRATTTQPAADWIRQLNDTQSRFFFGAFVLAVVLIYLLATLRWAYHYGMVSLVSKWRPGLPKPPLLYFVVTSAAWGMWLSLVYLVLAHGMWQWDSHGDFGERLSEYAQAHQNSILIILLIIGVVHVVASRNSGMGRKALYGGSSWICLMVDLIAIAILMLLAYAVAHL
jgi:hypothetical protein